MVSYDSDSSGDDDTDYTQTNVILGYASTQSEDETDTISHLGGRPVSGFSLTTMVSAWYLIETILLRVFHRSADSLSLGVD